MRYSDDIINRVKESNDVVEVIGQHLPLSRAGANFKALCPFHQEKTPSFMVNPARQIFHCFGCDTGGDVIRFVMLQEGLPFTDALRKLADRAGIELPEREAAGGLPRDQRDILYTANRAAAEYYAGRLMKGSEGERARSYLSGRGIHQEVSRAFGIGYAPGGWRSLLTRLSGQGIDAGTAVRAGLAVTPEGGKEPYDRFRDRVVFPIRDLSGRVLGFGGRVLGDELPKYINTPETEIYRKGDSLFAMDQAAAAVREKDEVLLVEGYLDAISLHQAGIRNVVGVLGTAFTPDQARRIRRLSRNCVLLFDSDEAGRKAALRSGLILLEEGFRCRVAPLEAGEDPDSYLRKRGAEALAERVRQAPHLVRYVLQDAGNRYPGEKIESRINILDAITPYLAKIRDRAELGLFLREVADELRVEQHDLRARLASETGKKQVDTGPRDSGVELNSRERLLVHIMIRDPSTVPRIREALRPEDFTSPGAANLVGRIYDGESLGDLLGSADDRMKDTLTGWAMEDPVEGMGESLESCLRGFHIEKLEKMLRRTKGNWTEAVEKGLATQAQENAREWQRLARQLDELKSRKERT